MNDEYIRKKDALDAIEARISELMTHPEFRRKHFDIDLAGIIRNIAAIKPADVVPVINDKAHWTDTNETVLEAKDKDSGEEFEISILAAKCSVCGRWAEQVNAFPPYMHYEYCPHCSRKMD